ncbi:MAG TPA: YsnF/AvaK domain-containing protein [Chloroflexota bacterium]|nr:YsnF/AvaK domain-containing protein [Chloroflexota bacterium]
MELTEEYLVAQKEPVPEGEVRIHKEVETVLQRIAVEAAHDEIHVDHVPINQSVSRRLQPWHEDDAIIVPVYEERVVVTRRLVLKEKLRIRRVKATERQHFAEEVRRERPVIQELGRPGRVQEHYATEHPPTPPAPPPRPEPAHRREPASLGIFHRLTDWWDEVA